MSRHMGAQAVLVPAQLSLAPGGEVAGEITVTNSGRVVDSFALEILGPAAQWTRCEPETVSVFPGQSAVAHVIFRPPADGSVPAGPLTFGVHVRSHEDPSGSVVAEGVLEIDAVTALTAELSPRTDRARGRRRSKHQLAVDNRGNAPATVEVVGFDEQDVVDVVASPQQLDVGAGSAAFVTVRAKARHRFWKGPGQTKPFAVEVRSPGATPIRLNGTLLNEGVVPGWLPKAIAGVLVGAGALAALWFAAFKPTIKDTASDAANDQVKVVLSQAGVATNGKGGGNGNGAGGAQLAGSTGQQAEQAAVEDEEDAAARAGRLLADPHHHQPEPAGRLEAPDPGHRPVLPEPRAGPGPAHPQPGRAEALRPAAEQPGVLRPARADADHRAEQPVADPDDQLPEPRQQGVLGVGVRARIHPDDRTLTNCPIGRCFGRVGLLPGPPRRLP
jgi:hypothetical protein